jgi:hypothetical protein
MSATEDLLANRYGKKKATSPAQRRAIIAIATSLLAAFLGWAGWVSLANWLEPKAELLGYTIVDQWHSTAKVKIGVSGNDQPTCAVQAQNEKFAIVGYYEVQFDYVPDQVKTIKINTTEMPVSISILRCW